MKILISGSSGFVGKHLIGFLNQHNPAMEVLPVSASRGKISYKDVFQAKIDYDVCIHLAGIAHDTKSHYKREDYKNINTRLTQKLYDAFLCHPKAKKFIYLSSIKALREASKIPLTEDMKAKPKGIYGTSKMQAENYLLKKHTEKQCYILRPPLILGKNIKGNLLKLINHIEQGKKIPLGAFHNKRAYLSIDNFNYIIKNILSLDIPSGIYHICDDKHLSFPQLCKMISVQNAGEMKNILNISKPLVYLYAFLASLLKLPLNLGQLKKMTQSLKVSNEKITHAIGPLPYHISQGIERMF